MEHSTPSKPPNNCSSMKVSKCVCINVLLLCDKLPQYLVVQKNKNTLLLYRSFCESGIQKRLSWVPWLRVSQAAVIFRLTWRRTTCRLTHMGAVRIWFLEDCWAEGLSSLLTVDWKLRYLLCGPLQWAAHSMAAGFSESEQAREQETGSEMEAKVFS